MMYWTAVRRICEGFSSRPNINQLMVCWLSALGVAAGEQSVNLIVNLLCFEERTIPKRKSQCPLRSMTREMTAEQKAEAVPFLGNQTRDECLPKLAPIP